MPENRKSFISSLLVLNLGGYGGVQELAQHVVRFLCSLNQLVQSQQSECCDPLLLNNLKRL